MRVPVKNALEALKGQITLVKKIALLDKKCVYSRGWYRVALF